MPLRIGLSRLVEPVFDPALVATGETLAPTLRMVGDFSAFGTLAVLQDGAPIDPALLQFDSSSAVIGPIAVGTSATELRIAPCAGQIVTYGAGSAGTGGVAPSLSAVGCAEPGQAVTLAINGGLGGAAGLLAIGPEQASLPIGGGATLLVGPALQLLLLPVTLASGGSGTGTWSVTWVLPPALPGSLAFQALVTDPASPIGFATSNGVAFDLP